jgi:hypothetical protein
LASNFKFQKVFSKQYLPLDVGYSNTFAHANAIIEAMHLNELLALSSIVLQIINFQKLNAKSIDGFKRFLDG